MIGSPERQNPSAYSDSWLLSAGAIGLGTVQTIRGHCASCNLRAVRLSIQEPHTTFSVHPWNARVTLGIQKLFIPYLITYLINNLTLMNWQLPAWCTLDSISISLSKTDCTGLTSEHLFCNGNQHYFSTLLRCHYILYEAIWNTMHKIKLWPTSFLQTLHGYSFFSRISNLTLAFWTPHKLCLASIHSETPIFPSPIPNFHFFYFSSRVSLWNINSTKKLLSIFEDSTIKSYDKVISNFQEGIPV